MDGQKFDRWARSIADASSRRGLLKGLVGSLVAGFFVAGVKETEAAPSCRNKPNGIRCGQCGVCRNGTCGVDPTVQCGGCQRCNSTSMMCRPTNDACAACESCKPDGGGYRCKPLECSERQRCCSHRCISKDHCCSDRDCPDCGKCERGRCKRASEKEGQRCGTRDCLVCKNGECVNQTNNAECFDSNGQCCDGVCCAAGKTCCGHVCCTAGFCLGDVCCDPRGFSASGADFCCPFGPPCGEGDNARCCTEDQVCCEGECKAPADCCPEGNACGDECCGQEVLEICTSEGCCAFERGETACGPGTDPINDSVCCGSHEQCCPFGLSEAACCPKEDACCFGDCCPAGMRCIGDCFHQTGRGCCPESYPEGGCDVCQAAEPGRTAPR